MLAPSWARPIRRRRHKGAEGTLPAVRHEDVRGPHHILLPAAAALAAAAAQAAAADLGGELDEPALQVFREGLHDFLHDILRALIPEVVLLAPQPEPLRVHGTVRE